MLFSIAIIIITINTDPKWRWLAIHLFLFVCLWGWLNPHKNASQNSSRIKTSTPKSNKLQHFIHSIYRMVPWNLFHLIYLHWLTLNFHNWNPLILNIKRKITHEKYSVQWWLLWQLFKFVEMRMCDFFQTQIAFDHFLFPVSHFRQEVSWIYFLIFMRPFESSGFVRFVFASCLWVENICSPVSFGDSLFHWNRMRLFKYLFVESIFSRYYHTQWVE